MTNDETWQQRLAHVKRAQLEARGHFEPDPEVQAMISALTAAAAGLQRGDTLSWERVTEVIGLTREDVRFWTVVSAWRNRLRKEKHIETWSFGPNAGYTLLSHQDNIETVAKKRLQRATRQARKALRAIENTDVSQLTDKQMLMAHRFSERAKDTLKRGKGAENAKE